jgi:hypothetical protein
MHQPLRIGPCALVETNLVHVRHQPLCAPAQHPLLCLHRQKSDQREGKSHNTYQEGTSYSPLAKGHA